jgi:DNA polymerase III psi subunit
MTQELDAGYLATLFNEPIYTMGYAPVEVEEENTAPVPVVSPADLLPKKPMPELKTIPVTPKIEKTTPEVAAKATKKCILLYQSEQESLNTNEKTFLDKVMGAVKLQEEEYELINFSGLTINDIAGRYIFDKLVLFGVSIPGLSLTPYTCTQVKSTKILSADAVWMIEANTGLKKQLWDQLQVMFGFKAA